MCGAQLIPTMLRPDIVKPSTKILRRARIGARLLEGAIKDNNARKIHRAMRGVAFAVAVTSFRSSPLAAVQDFNPEIRIACLVAICAAQKKPLLKAARIMAKADGYAKASLLKSYSKEPHVLAAVRRIADRKAECVLTKDRVSQVGQGGSDFHNLSQQYRQKAR